MTRSRTWHRRGHTSWDREEKATQVSLRWESLVCATFIKLMCLSLVSEEVEE